MIFKHIYFLIFGFLFKNEDDFNKNLSIQWGIVCLWFSEWSSFPIWNLLYFAQALIFEQSSYNFLQRTLLLDFKHFTIVILSVQEICNVLYEFHMRELSFELKNVRVEAKSNDCWLRIFEHFFKHLIKWFATFESYKINQIDCIFATKLKQSRICFVELAHLWSHFRINTYKSLFQQSF